MPQVKIFLAIERPSDYGDDLINETTVEPIINNSNRMTNDSNIHTVFTWIGTSSNRDTPLIFSTLDDAETFIWTRQNLTPHEDFMRKHYWYMVNMAMSQSNVNDTLTIAQINYNCCYLNNKRTLCSMDQKVDNRFINHNVTNYSTIFPFDTMEYNRNTSELWIWLNETTVESVWPHINETLTMWNKLLDMIKMPITSRAVYGSTRVIDKQNNTSTVECLVRAKDSSPLRLSWFEDERHLETYTDIGVNTNGTLFGTKKSVLTVQNDKINNMYCYIAYKGAWGVMLPIPFEYNILPIQDTLPLALMLVVIVLFIIFIVTSIVVCCFCLYKFCSLRSKR